MTPGATGPWEQARPGPLGSAVLLREFAMDLYPPEITAVAYASRVFVPGRPLAEAVRDLTTRIFHDFTYESGSTAISKGRYGTRTAQGVCQDFARVALACLRSVGLAGRYESGYLATDPPGRERIYGADASHAWAAVWVPGETPGAETPGPGTGSPSIRPTTSGWTNGTSRWPGAATTTTYRRCGRDLHGLHAQRDPVSVDVCPVDPV